MDVIHFPDDPRPAALDAARCSRSAISTACTAATGRSSSACAACAAERGGDVRRHDLRSASAARRAARQGAAAADDHGAEARGARRGRHAGRGHRPLHAASCRSGIPRRSCRTVLVDWLRVAEVWVGANFLFGHDRAGNFSLLRTLGARYGFKAEKIDPVRYKDFVVSSTRIRRLVGEGRVDEAGALLGHQYCIDGTVVRRRRSAAATIGFPTANLATDNELLPPHGVYATTATIDGVVHPSVTNIGVRPTVRRRRARRRSRRTCFDFDRDLYGAPVRLGVRAAAARRAAVRRRRRAAARRSPPTAARARVLFDRLSL